MKVLGLSEAIINFMGTFSESPSDSIHTQKTKQFFFRAETDYWMVLTVSVPKIEREVEGEKGASKKVVVDYLEDLVIDETYHAVLKRIYNMFKLFNGSINSILSRHSIKDLKLRIEHFCNKYLPTIHFDHCDIMDVFGGLFFLPLDHNSYLKVQSFVSNFECLFPKVHTTMLIYNSQLIWSGLEQPDTKLMFHFLLSSVYPAIFEKDFIFTTPTSLSKQPSNSTDSSTITHIPSSSFNPSQPSHTPASSVNTMTTILNSNPNLCHGIRIGSYTLGPPDLTNPNNLGQIPLVHLSTDPSPLINLPSPSTSPPASQKLCRLLVYKLCDVLICILVEGSENPPFEMMVLMDSYLSTSLPLLVNLLTPTVKKGPPEHSYKYVYYNRVNDAQKTTIHNPHHTTLNTSPQLLNILSSIHQSFKRVAENEDKCFETMVKLGEGGWVVARKGEGRELYVVVEQKAAGLVAINDEVKKICSSHFPNLFFTDS